MNYSQLYYRDIEGLTLHSGLFDGMINAISTSVPTYLVINAFNTLVNVGNSGSVQGIRGTLNIENPPEQHAVIDVDDSADATARTVTLSSFVNPDDSEGNNDLWGKIHGLAPADINYECADIRRVSVLTGTAGSGNVINVLATHSPETNLVAHAAATVNVGDAGSVQGILGTLNIENPPSRNTITVDDSADATARTVTLSSFVNPDDSEDDGHPWGKIHGLAPADINYEYPDTSSVSVLTGTAGSGNVINGNVINVLATHSPETNLVAHAAATVNVGDAGSVQGILGTLNIENPPSRNTITVDDSADATARTVTLSSFVNPDDSDRNSDPWGKIRGLALADINYEYSDTAHVTINNSGTAADTIIIADPQAAEEISFTAPVLGPLNIVTGIVVNDGSAQRSMVTRLTVNFSGPVTIAPNAFELRRQDGALVSLNAAPAADGRSVVLTFTGSDAIGSSLADGLYTLIVHGDKIHDGLGQALDGDANGTAGGDYVDAAIERLFGDADGDGDVDNSDVFAFKAAYGKSSGQGGYQPFFDFNGDGTINTLDFGEVKQRYGKRI